MFYEGQQFPAACRHGAFLAGNGSWNRHLRSGYEVVCIPFDNGAPAGIPTPFFCGFVSDPAGKEVYGCPVGVAVAADGPLLISVVMNREHVARALSGCYTHCATDGSAPHSALRRLGWRATAANGTPCWNFAAASVRC